VLVGANQDEVVVDDLEEGADRARLVALHLDAHVRAQVPSHRLSAARRPVRRERRLTVINWHTRSAGRSVVGRSAG